MRDKKISWYQTGMISLIGIFFLFVLPLIFFLRVKKKTAEELAISMKAASEAH